MLPELFSRLRDLPRASKLGVLLVYGLITFLLIYGLAMDTLENELFFRIFEFFWFVHIVIICNQIHRSQKELFTLAMVALSPGIVHNLLVLTQILQGA